MSGKPERLVPLLVSSEVCDILRVSEVTLRRLVETSQLRAVRFRRFVRFDPAEVRRFCRAASSTTTRRPHG